MDYSIQDLIGMMNLAIIISNDEFVNNIPKEAALEIVTYLQELKTMTEVINQE